MAINCGVIDEWVLVNAVVIFRARWCVLDNCLNETKAGVERSEGKATAVIHVPVMQMHSVGW